MRLLATLALSATFLLPSAAQAAIIYTDFSDVSAMQLNGDTIVVNDKLRLTSATQSQSGSAFHTNTVSLDNDASFSSAFNFQITQSGGVGSPAGADGIVFAVQTVSNSAGGLGGGLGYQGITNSVGVEFDTYNNGNWDDNNGNHVGLNLNGNIDSVTQTAWNTPFNNDSIWRAWVDYDGMTDALSVRIAEGENKQRSESTLMFTYTVDLVSILGSTDVYVGFTSGTGSGYGNHDITAWQFNSTFDPIDTIEEVPEPKTIAFFSLALLGLTFVRRKS